jgi:hypothetical protein
MKWSKDKDDFLRQWYNDKVKVDPACLAMSLNLKGMNSVFIVINRLSELQLRNKRKTPDVKRIKAT